jgi:hypothetical protein
MAFAMAPSMVELFQIEHQGHQVDREERRFEYEQVAAVPTLREQWKPGIVFVVLYCHDCNAFVVIDRADSNIPDQ